MKEIRVCLVEKQKLSCCLQGCILKRCYQYAWPYLWYIGLNELGVLHVLNHQNIDIYCYLKDTLPAWKDCLIIVNVLEEYIL